MPFNVNANVKKVKLNLIIEAQFAFLSKMSMNVENSSENIIRFEF